MIGTFVDPHLIDGILALVAGEFILCVALRKRWSRSPAPTVLIPTLLSGAFLLFALREALAGAAGWWIALALLGALFAHLLDLWTRWPR